MKQAVDKTKIPSIPDAKILVLKSRWYPELTESLAGACRSTLEAAGCTNITEYSLSGALELPFAIHHLVRTKDAKFDAIICLGIILKGETMHFEMITEQVFAGLARISLDVDTPVIVEILPVTDLRQAEERARDDEHNKGIEAASAAAEMIAWCRTLK